MLAPPAAACPVEGRYRIVASLVSTWADHILVFPDDSWFETAALLADAVVRTGVDGAPALVELPSRGLKVGDETLTVWGADAAEGEVLFVQSNPIDVQLVLRPAPASAGTSTFDRGDDGAEAAP